MQNGVTIGIPVYNEELLVERAIRSAAGQCARLIISDNASTDNTGDVCRKLVDEFSNIEYVRQSENLGAIGNWSRILEMVESEYLLFLGAHDYLGPEAITCLLEKLNSGPDILCAYGQLFYDYDGRIVEDVLFNKWTGGIQETPQARIKSLLYTRISLGWTVYGLFRTLTMKELFHHCLRPQGGDIILMGHVLAKGKIIPAAGARYYAWVREKHKALPSDYHERVLGKKVTNKKMLRNESKIAKHEMLISAHAPLSALEKIYYRVMSTIHIGTFKYPGLDVAYYLLLVPAKILRVLIRINYRLKQLVYSLIGQAGP
jgi:glycosyltransferase involved in cell wall biosynthesis